MPTESNQLPTELTNLKKEWGWLLALGVGLVLFGATAISMPLVATVGFVTVLGILLLVGGVAQIVSAFHSSEWSGFLLHLLIGILYIVTGFLILENPVEGAAGLTLLLAAFFFISGVFRIVVAMRERFPSWGWTLLNGAVTVLLGIIIWRQFPVSSLWVIGLLVGIEFLFNGWSWIMLSFALKNLPTEGEAATASAGSARSR